MSYQVLARKWRPQTFQQMVGQTHVLRALITALQESRLHHAYLFTGTRGVGKTTVARIFAKCLNCETGVTAEPCGTCRSCVEIAEGRHVDLIEVDAASRTKVEDTRELLDNVQYAPTRGRYKIYLIDEVHMLSGHSFNALLKTLEEPPPHVKFLFATTDPQKLPVTILSRCLQFNLKRMALDLISGHLSSVLTEEQIKFTPTALKLLARAADGSMRDALSLTDQAIVTGGGAINDETVQDMLGLMPAEYLMKLVHALLEHNAIELIATVEQMAQLTTDFATATESLISLLHQLAVSQFVPSEDPDIQALAEAVSAADLQLYYQLALHARRDLPLNPDPRSGFEMLLLRMLAFKLDDTKNLVEVTKKKILTTPNPRSSHPPKPTIEHSEPESVQPAVAVKQAQEKNEWHIILPQLKLGGIALQLAEHCLLSTLEETTVQLALDPEWVNLQTRYTEEQLTEALCHFLGREVRVILTPAKLEAETPGQYRLRLSKELQTQAEQSMQQDEFVRELQERFGAVLVPGSVKPRLKQ